ncbi:MAG: phosphate uptake regulator PhoU [Fervidicoccaceae archaeon]
MSFSQREREIERIKAQLRRLHGICDALLARALEKKLTVREAEEAVWLAEHVRDEIVTSILLFMARRQPLGKDLIFAKSALGASYDLYRIVRYVRENALLSEIAAPGSALIDEGLRSAIFKVSEMLRDAVRGLIDGDVEAAKGVLRMDEEIDSLYELSLSKLRSSSALTSVETARLLVLRHIERMADHATYVARTALELHQA